MPRNRRGRHRDKSSAGGSERVGFRPGERAMVRHDRRLRVNLNSEEELREWADPIGIEITITNEGHHWRLTLIDELAEWWPSSAKLVFNKDWPNGVHVHDIDRLREQLVKHWKLEE